MTTIFELVKKYPKSIIEFLNVYLVYKRERRAFYLEDSHNKRSVLKYAQSVGLSVYKDVRSNFLIGIEEDTESYKKDDSEVNLGRILGFLCYDHPEWWNANDKDRIIYRICVNKKELFTEVGEADRIDEIKANEHYERLALRFTECLKSPEFVFTFKSFKTISKKTLRDKIFNRDAEYVEKNIEFYKDVFKFNFIQGEVFEWLVFQSRQRCVNWEFFVRFWKKHLEEYKYCSTSKLLVLDYDYSCELAKGSHEFESHEFESHEFESDEFESHEFESHEFESHDFESHDFESHEFESHEFESHESH